MRHFPNKSRPDLALCLGLALKEGGEREAGEVKMLKGKGGGKRKRVTTKRRKRYIDT